MLQSLEDSQLNIQRTRGTPSKRQVRQSRRHTPRNSPRQIRSVVSTPVLRPSYSRRSLRPRGSRLDLLDGAHITSFPAPYSAPFEEQSQLEDDEEGDNENSVNNNTPSHLHSSVRSSQRVASRQRLVPSSSRRTPSRSTESPLRRLQNRLARNAAIREAEHAREMREYTPSDINVDDIISLTTSPPRKTDPERKPVQLLRSRASTSAGTSAGMIVGPNTNAGPQTRASLTSFDSVGQLAAPSTHLDLGSELHSGEEIFEHRIRHCRSFQPTTSTQLADPSLLTDLSAVAEDVEYTVQGIDIVEDYIPRPVLHQPEDFVEQPEEDPTWTEYLCKKLRWRWRFQGLLR